MQSYYYILSILVSHGFAEANHGSTRAAFHILHIIFFIFNGNRTMSDKITAQSLKTNSLTTNSLTTNNSIIIIETINYSS